ncbi:glycoside hydrolase family 35 protein [Streptomyces sp. NPDC048441]|uniref:glycoside hydrolase family 35 protein n=1 Tax=Streptomyces sp. NPDC048441 TaxID=3365552 RepID=UPI003718F8CA
MNRTAPDSLLTYPDGALLRDGTPHRILAGTLHYFRVHPDQWRDRLERLASMGLNTVDTYVAWNFHERHQGEPDFEGRRDIERFIRLAGRTGLDVIVRPGPYICAEWDNGGLPAWLTDRPGMRLRSSYAPYLAEVARWFDVLVPKIAALQAVHGGPVVAVQVENEYGSYGDDHAYVRWIHEGLTSRGITELLYTADGPTELMLDGGTLPGVLATATFGARADQAAGLLRSRREREPFICAEFWNGWFDHWGEKHHTRSATSAAETLADIIDHDGSVSLYPAHGGTNFGLWAGANHSEGALQPTVTSYDSHAPIAEHGELTPKFFALRDCLRSVSDAAVLERPLPPDPKLLKPQVLPVTRGSGLLDALVTTTEAVPAADPLSFGELGQASGLVLYRAHPLLPHGPIELTISGLHDRAQVFVDGTPAGVIDRESGSLGLKGAGERIRLDILVENQGRINYGPLLGQGKGILGGVRLERRLVHGWSMYRLPLDEWSADDIGRAVAVAAAAPEGGSGFATATFSVDDRADTFLSLPGFGKGFAWVNGSLLGRYWEIGPQQTLYVPAPLLVRGENLVTVLELTRFGVQVELRDSPELGPTEEYVETFS